MVMVQNIIKYFDERMSNDKCKERNLNLIAEILVNHKVELVEKLRIHENFKNGDIEWLLEYLIENKTDYPTILLTLECLIRVKRHYSSCKQDIDMIQCKLNITEQEQVFYYMIKVIFAKDIGYNYYLLMQYDVEIIENLWLHLISYKLNKIEIIFHIMTISFTLMLKDENLVKKYQIITGLEEMLSKIIINSNGQNVFFERVIKQKRIGKKRVKLLRNYDLKNGKFQNIIEVFDNLPIGYARNIIGYVIINKSRFLDRYALLCFYLSNFDYEGIGEEVNHINPKMFDENLKNELRNYIRKHRKQRVALYMALQRFIPDDLKEWRLITTQNFKDYFKKVGYLNFWYDVLDEFTYYIDIPDYNLYETRIYSKFSLNLIKTQNDLNLQILTSQGRKGLVWKFFSNLLKVTDVVNELELVVDRTVKILRLLFSSKEEIMQNIIIASKICDNVVMSSKFLSYIEVLVRMEYEEYLSIPVNEKNYQHENVQAMIKLYLSSVEFMDFAILRYHKLNHVTKTIILLGLEKEIKVYEREFIRIVDKTTTYQPLLINVYKKAPILAQDVFKKMEIGKNYYFKRLRAFRLIVSAYCHQFDDILEEKLSTEKNEKLQNMIKEHLESK